MPPAETDTSSPSTPPWTSVVVAVPVAGLSATSAPWVVTATIAGGAAATGLVPPEGWALPLGWVTVTVGAGAGVPLDPHADSTAAAAAAPARAAAYRITGILHLHSGLSRGTGT